MGKGGERKGKREGEEEGRERKGRGHKEAGDPSHT